MRAKELCQNSPRKQWPASPGYFPVVLWCFAAFVFLTAPGSAGQASKPTPADLCRQAAVDAATATGVPPGVLLAITLTETGRRKNGAFQPWPWTVNMQGKGVWFDSRAEALAYAETSYASGARSFDVGCFQINYKWHGQAFTSINQMFDPDANATYAARFLLRLFAEKGNWVDAAGAYHSKTPKLANRYKKRFKRIYAGLGEVDLPPTLPPTLPVASSKQPRDNNYPLLQQRPQGQASSGSLVTLIPGEARPALISPPKGRLF
jgi:transglycosylase-like protein with SLT domain